jgi:hypothetical protein
MLNIPKQSDKSVVAKIASKAHLKPFVAKKTKI